MMVGHFTSSSRAVSISGVMPNSGPNARRAGATRSTWSVPSHWLWKWTTAGRAFGSSSIRRICRSTPARVASSPATAAANSSASGIESQRK